MERYSLKMDKEAAPPPQLYLTLHTERRIVRDSVSASHFRIEPLHFTTVKIGKVGKVFVIFFFKKNKISTMYKTVYSFSCKMIYSFSFSFASLRRYRTIFFVSPYLLARNISVTLSVL